MLSIISGKWHEGNDLITWRVFTWERGSFVPSQWRESNIITAEYTESFRRSLMWLHFFFFLNVNIVYIAPFASVVNSAGWKSHAAPLPTALRQFKSWLADLFSYGATCLWLAFDPRQSLLSPPSDNAAWAKIPDPRATAEEADPSTVTDFGQLNER